MSHIAQPLIDTAAGVLVTGFAGGVAAVIRLALKQSRTISTIHRDWTGTPGRPGVPRVPGVMERLQAGDAHFAQIDARTEAMSGRLEAVEITLQHVADEMPKNGQPLAVKIDALYQRLIVQGEPHTTTTGS